MTISSAWFKHPLSHKVIELGQNIMFDAAGTPYGATVGAQEFYAGNLHKTILTCATTPITFTDVPHTEMYGGVKIYDFPAGSICTLGAVVSGTLSIAAALATFAGGVALGTVTATTGTTLASTEADIMQEVDVAAAAANVATISAVQFATALTESGATWLDGTATAKDMYLNFVIDENAANVTGLGYFSGTVTVTWINLGDK